MGSCSLVDQAWSSRRTLFLLASIIKCSLQLESLFDVKIIAGFHVKGVNTDGNPFLQGPFECDTMMGRRCNAYGPAYTSHKCDTVSEATAAAVAGATPLNDRDGYKREVLTYTCHKGAAPQEPGCGSVKLLEAPITCLQTTFMPTGSYAGPVALSADGEESTAGDSDTVSVGMRQGSGGAGRGNGMETTRCTCFARGDWTGRNAPGLSPSLVDTHYPLDERYPEGTGQARRSTGPPRAGPPRPFSADPPVSGARYSGTPGQYEPAQADAQGAHSIE